jgi:hypothetical protein
MSLLNTIEANANFPLILKILGITFFGLSFIASWAHVPLFYKLGMIAGILAYIVGDKFVKVYSKTP